MNITLHSAKRSPIILGLSAIEGSCDSGVIIALVKEKLKEFGIEMDKDIVGSSHDGAAVMVKYGNNISPLAQLCYNHGVHLAVLDVFYKKVGYKTLNDAESDDENFQDNDNSEDSDDYDVDRNDEIASAFAFDGNLNFEDDTPSELPHFLEDIGKNLAKTRKIVKNFKNSAVRSSVLQKHVV